MSEQPQEQLEGQTALDDEAQGGGEQQEAVQAEAAGSAATVDQGAADGGAEGAEGGSNGEG